MSKISVIIPTFNRENTLKLAMESVLNQTYSVDELIIVDDGSTDNTKQLVEDMMVQDARIKYYCMEKNGGAGKARNYGVSMASNDIIAFHDSDDMWLDYKLEKQMEIMDNKPDCVAVYSAYAADAGSPDNDKVYIIPTTKDMTKLQGNIFSSLLIENSIGAPTLVMKKAVFEELGGYDTSMNSLEDWDFSLKLAKKYSIDFIPEPLMVVSLSGKRISNNISAYYSSRCYLLRKYIDDYKQYGLFETAITDIMTRAERAGVLEPVKKLLLTYMQQ